MSAKQTTLTALTHLTTLWGLKRHNWLQAIPTDLNSSLFIFRHIHSSHHIQSAALLDCEWHAKSRVPASKLGN